MPTQQNYDPRANRRPSRGGFGSQSGGLGSTGFGTGGGFGSSGSMGSGAGSNWTPQSDAGTFGTGGLMGMGFNTRTTDGGSTYDPYFGSGGQQQFDVLEGASGTPGGSRTGQIGFGGGTLPSGGGFGGFNYPQNNAGTSNDPNYQGGFGGGGGGGGFSVGNIAYDDPIYMASGGSPGGGGGGGGGVYGRDTNAGFWSQNGGRGADPTGRSIGQRREPWSTTDDNGISYANEAFYPVARGDGTGHRTSQEVVTSFTPLTQPPATPPQQSGIDSFFNNFFSNANSGGGMMGDPFGSSPPRPPQQQILQRAPAAMSSGLSPAEQQLYQTPGMFDDYNQRNGISSAPNGWAPAGSGRTGPRGEIGINPLPDYQGSPGGSQKGSQPWQPTPGAIPTIGSEAQGEGGRQTIDPFSKAGPGGNMGDPFGGSKPQYRAKQGHGVEGGVQGTYGSDWTQGGRYQGPPPPSMGGGFFGGPQGTGGGSFAPGSFSTGPTEDIPGIIGGDAGSPTVEWLQGQSKDIQDNWKRLLPEKYAGVNSPGSQGGGQGNPYGDVYGGSNSPLAKHGQTGEQIMAPGGGFFGGPQGTGGGSFAPGGGQGNPYGDVYGGSNSPQATHGQTGEQIMAPGGGFFGGPQGTGGGSFAPGGGQGNPGKYYIDGGGRTGPWDNQGQQGGSSIWAGNDGKGDVVPYEGPKYPGPDGMNSYEAREWESKNPEAMRQYNQQAQQGNTTTGPESQQPLGPWQQRDENGNIVSTCFVAGTPITTPGGESRIEDLKVGDKVIAFDHEGDIEVESDVVDVLESSSDEIYAVKVGDTVLEVTGEHPFWVEEAQDYIPVKELSGGDSVKIYGAASQSIDSIDLLVGKSAPVFNITVDQEHNYFAGGVLVHNKSMIDPNALDANGVPYGETLGTPVGQHGYKGYNRPSQPNADPYGAGPSGPPSKPGPGGNMGDPFGAGPSSNETPARRVPVNQMMTAPYNPNDPYFKPGGNGYMPPPPIDRPSGPPEWAGHTNPATGRPYTSAPSKRGYNPWYMN